MKFAGTPLPVLEILTQHSSYNAAKVIASVLYYIFKNEIMKNFSGFVMLITVEICHDSL